MAVMETSTLSRARHLASTEYARAIRLKGLAHPDTVAAGRKFGAAKLAETAESARGYGLTDLDLVAVVQTGELPASVTA
jgi:hypothetical protein